MNHIKEGLKNDFFKKAALKVCDTAKLFRYVYNLSRRFL